MIILKGYSKDEQKELENAKKYMRCSDLLRNITGNPVEARCILIGEKYDKAETNKQSSIIKDILDFYTGEAKFSDKKYYVHLIKSDRNSYLKTDMRGEVYLDSNFEYGIWKTKFTRDEVVAIDPRLVTFMEEVENDE